MVRHEAVIPLLDVASTDDGLTLTYPWVDGEVLYPAAARARFRALPAAEVVAALDAIFDAHVAIAHAGFVAVDLYDGCLIYDFDRRRMRLCDLDEYRPGPFVLDEERLPGSKRFMAPEELRRGATIDQRTTVYHLGRTALVLGPTEPHAVLSRATAPDPADRHPTVLAFVDAWREAVA